MLLNVTLKARRPLEQMKTLTARSARVEKALGKNGRLLVRWSGTEPKLRIMLEGPNENHLRAWAEELANDARRDVTS